MAVSLAGIGKARHCYEWQQYRSGEKMFALHGFCSRSTVKRVRTSLAGESASPACRVQV
jgi:hypothetical protein